MGLKPAEEEALRRLLVLVEGSLFSSTWELLRLLARELERGAPPARAGRAACSDCARPARSSRGGVLLCRFCAVERRCRRKRATLTARVARRAAAEMVRVLRPGGREVAPAAAGSRDDFAELGRARWDPEGAWRRRARALGRAEPS